MKTELESRMEKVYAGVTLSREGRVVPSMYLPANILLLFRLTLFYLTSFFPF